MAAVNTYCAGQPQKDCGGARACDNRSSSCAAGAFPFMFVCTYQLGPNNMTETVWGQRLNHPLFDGREIRRDCGPRRTEAASSTPSRPALNFRGYRDASHVEQARLGHQLRQKVTAEEHYDAFVETVDPAVRGVLDEHGEPIVPTLAQVQDTAFPAGDFCWRLSSHMLGITIVVLEGPSAVYVTPGPKREKAPPRGPHRVD